MFSFDWIRALCCLAVFWGLNTPPTYAAQEKIKTPELLHFAPRARDLSAPGEEMTLEVQVDYSNSLKHRVRALVVSDGRLMDLPMIDSYLNEDDLPTFKFKLFGPLAELSYQFVLYNDDGVLDVSKRYHVQRSCLPSIDLASVVAQAQEGSQDAKQGLKNLLLEAQALESELRNYENALTLLNGLKQLTDKK